MKVFVEVWVFGVCVGGWVLGGGVWGSVARVCLTPMMYVRTNARTAEPPSFVTKALQQTKVECTWDLGDEEVSESLCLCCVFVSV